VGDLQIEVGSGAKPNVTFYSGGTLTDLDGTCTVTLTKPDGTAGPASGTVSHAGATGSGEYEFTLDPQTELTYYDVTWAGTIGAVAVSVATRVEVVGGFLYILAALRSMKVGGTANAFASTTSYPDQTLLDRRAEVTDDFEARTGWSFIPRFTRERHTGDRTGTLIVRQYKPATLLSVTVDGTAQTLTDFDLDDEGVLTWQGGTFPATRPANVWVEYVRGWDRVAPAVSNAGLARTAMLLLPSQAGSTVSTWTTPDGTTYQRDLAGQSIQGGGIRHYGVPGIDSVLNTPAYNTKGGVFA
jgi:hypothetical protein